MIIIIPYPPSINGIRLTERESDIIFTLADGRYHATNNIVDTIFPVGAIPWDRPNSLIRKAIYHIRKKLINSSIKIEKKVDLDID